MKMTAKYSTALAVAQREKMTITYVNQEQLYQALQEKGFHWDSDLKQWQWHDPAEADDPTPFVLIRVWANEEITPEVADDVTRSLKKLGLYDLVERSEPYRCRPPKQREARIYLRFQPKPKGTNQ